MIDLWSKTYDNGALLRSVHSKLFELFQVEVLLQKEKENAKTELDEEKAEKVVASSSQIKYILAAIVILIISMLIYLFRS